MSFKYVFRVDVRPGEEEDFIEHWHNGSIPIQEFAGARGTKLHKVRGTKSSFIAIAEWENRSARQKAMRGIYMGLDKDRSRRVKEWGANEDFGEVTLLGEIEQVDEVMPPS